MSLKYTEGKKMDDVFHKSTLICFTKGKDMLVRNLTTVKKNVHNQHQKESVTIFHHQECKFPDLFQALNFPDL